MDDERQTEHAPARHSGSAANPLEPATLESPGRAGIPGLALIFRAHSADGGKFYPATLHDAGSLPDLPATLRLSKTAETFVLTRLQPGCNGEACFDLSFQG